MAELERVASETKPTNVLLVLDAMTGQEAVSVALAFQERVAFDGVVLTKLDGDARGGAALSVRAVTGRPVKLVSVGEKLDQLEYFHPDRMASRILGMGDVLTLIEKAEAAVEEDEQAEMEKRIRAGEFTFDDFLASYRMIRKMGPLQGVLKMIPGMGKQLQGLDLDERQLARVEAIVLSMTPHERRDAARDFDSTPSTDSRGQRNVARRGQQAHGRPQADGEDDEADGEGEDADAAAGGRRPQALACRLHQRERHIQHMAVKIRLTRVGSKKNPIYRVVVADSRSPRDGRFIEIVGRYNPQTDPSTIDLDEAKIRDWMAKGAQPTAPVSRLIRAAGFEGGYLPATPLISDALLLSAVADLLEWLARRLVDEPDAVRVETEEREDAIVFHLHVAPDDVGKVIGKQGRLARALRSIVRAGGARADERYVLEIAD